MIVRALFLLLLARIAVALRGRATAPSPRRAAAKTRRTPKPALFCACRLREVLDERGLTSLRFASQGLSAREMTAFRAGHAIPTPEQKIAILHVINSAHPRSRKPKLEWEDLFGHSATPRYCVCAFRRLLDERGLTVGEIASELNVDPKIVRGWRAGVDAPAPEQLARIRALARQRSVVVPIENRRAS